MWLTDKFEEVMQAVKADRARSRFGPERRARFYMKMEQFTITGRPMDDALKIIHARYESEKDPLSFITQQWIDEAAHTGFTMRVATGWIPDDELGLILAAEGTATPASGFAQAMQLAKTRHQMSVQTVKALTTPLAGLALNAIIFVLFYLGLSPVMQEISPIEKWPAIARGAHVMGWAVTYGAIPLVIIGFLLSVRIKQTMPTWTGVWRHRFDRLPPWSINKRMAACGLLVALAGMMKQGRPLDTAIKEYQRTASPYLQDFLDDIRIMKASGKDEAAAMDVGLFDRETAGDIADMGKGGGASLQVAMQTLGDGAQTAALAAIDKISGVIKYTITALIALNIVWIYGSFVMTTYKATADAKAQTQQMGN